MKTMTPENHVSSVSEFRKIVELGDGELVIEEYDKLKKQLESIVNGMMSLYGDKEVSRNDASNRAVDAIKDVALAAIKLSSEIGTNYMKAHFNE